MYKRQELENLDFDVKGKTTSKRTYKGESTDAKDRDGTVCSSVKIFVIEI